MTRIIYAAQPVDTAPGTPFAGADVKVIDGLLINTPEYAAKHAARVAALAEQAALHSAAMARHAPGTREHDEARYNLWMCQRFAGISGTAAGTVIGVNKWQTPFAYWQEATFRVHAGNVSNPAMEWGQRKEPVVAQKYCDAHNCYLKVPETFTSPLFPFMTASPDRIVLAPDGSESRILEIKCTGFNRSIRNDLGVIVDQDWGPGNQDGMTDSAIPVQYIAQVMHYMLATGIYTADVAVLIGHDDYREYTIELDAEQAEDLIRAEDEFYCRNILDDVRPADMTASDWGKVKPVKSSAVEATPEMLELARDLANITSQIKVLEAREKTLRDALIGFIGEKEGMLYDGAPVATYAGRERAGSFDSKKLSIDHPELYEKYKGEKTFYRVFSLKLK